MCLIVQERESATMSCTRLMHSRKKMEVGGLLFSGTRVPSIHYLDQFKKAIVVVVSIFQPISSKLLQETLQTRHKHPYTIILSTN